jgi:PKD repeat protein
VSCLAFSLKINKEKHMKNFVSLLLLTFVFGGLFAQAPFPFEDDFDSDDLNLNHWTPRPNLEGTDGVVGREDGIGLNGTAAVRIGKSEDGSFTTNALDLSIDLSGQTDVEMTFWIADSYDGTNAEDGIYFSDNGGSSFVKVLDFFPDEWCSTTYGQHPPLDVDELAAAVGLSLTSQFVIRFQQRGEDDFSGNTENSEDGFYIDNVQVYDSGLVYHDLSQGDFEDDFETGVFNDSWAWNFADATSSVNGVSAITSPMSIVAIQEGIGIEGTRGVAMGRRCDGPFTTNALDLHLNLSNVTDVEMTFWIADSYDSTDDDDGIYFSDDGGNTYVKVLDFFPDEWCSTRYGQHPPLDVDGLAAAVGLSLTSQFVIRFQQRGEDDFSGNTEGSEDGFYIDEVRVYDPGLVYHNLSQEDFFDDFEIGLFDDSWAWNFADATSTVITSNAVTSPMGVVSIEDGVGADNTRGVIMGRRCDGDGVFTTNALDLHLNLSNQGDVAMTFLIADSYDGTDDDDGIYFSDDGGNSFSKVFSFDFSNAPNLSFVDYQLSVSDLATANNLVLTDQFVVRFQQRGEDDFGGNTEGSEDGIYLDSVYVTGTISNCNLSLSTTNITNAVCNDPTGEATIVPSGGTPPYSYTLSGPTPGTINSGNPAVFADLLPGSYSVVVSDAEDCSANIDFIIGNDGAITAPGIITDVNDLTVDFSFDTSVIIFPTDSIVWDFGDGNMSTDTFPTHTYAAEGTYTVTLSIYEIECGVGITQGTVTVSGGGTAAPDPTSSFVPSETSGCAPLSVTFENTSTDAVAYQWIIDGVTPSLYTTFEPGTITFTQPGIYSVRLEAENADGVEDVSEVMIEVQDVPVADFSVQLNGTTASITNLSYPDIDLIDQVTWDYGDGNTSSETATTFDYTYAAPGNYTISLSLSNACGSDEQSRFVTLEPNAGEIALDVGENEGFEGDVVLVPVILKEYVGTLAALQGTARFATSGVAEFQGFTGNLISAGNIQFNDANGQFSALAPNGLSTTGNDTLFFLNVLLSGNPGDSTDIFIDDDPNIFTRLEVTIFENGAIGTINSILLIDGWVRIFESADLDGLIYFWEDFSPVNLVDVNLDFAGTPLDPDLLQTTGPDGTYFFDNVDAGQDVEIYCVKETNPVNGVTTGPLFLVQQYTVLGPGPVGQYNSPYQMVASDADCNDVINAADIIRVQQVIVGNPLVDLCKSWTFVPEFYANLAGFNMNDQPFVLSYPEEVSVNQIQDDTTFNFVGVKVGDILGNADPASLLGDTPVDTRSSAELTLQAYDRELAAGETFELQFTSSDFQNMGGLQMALEFAADQLAFEGFVAEEQALQPQYYHEPGSGMLRLSWVDPTAMGLSLEDEETVLKLRFQALQPVDAIADLLWINTNSMRAEAMDTNLGAYQVQLEWQSLTSTAGIQEQGYFLYQNAPNPAKGETLIKFTLPFAQRAALEVVDPLGRVVARYEQVFPKGFSELLVPTRNMQAGLYRYRLTTEAYTATKTMVVAQ